MFMATWRHRLTLGGGSQIDVGTSTDSSLGSRADAPAMDSGSGGAVDRIVPEAVSRAGGQPCAACGGMRDRVLCRWRLLRYRLSRVVCHMRRARQAGYVHADSSRDRVSPWASCVPEGRPVRLHAERVVRWSWQMSALSGWNTLQAGELYRRALHRAGDL